MAMFTHGDSSKYSTGNVQGTEVSAEQSQGDAKNTVVVHSGTQSSRGTVSEKQTKNLGGKWEDS